MLKVAETVEIENNAEEEDIEMLKHLLKVSPQLYLIALPKGLRK